MKQTTRNKPAILRKSIFVLLAVVLLLPAGRARAGETVMEIFYLPHRPAEAVVQEVEKVAAEFSDLVVRKYSFDDPAAEKRVKKYNLAGHMPVAVFIDGRNSFTVNGHTISLRNFPKGNSFVPMFAGEWDYADLRTILKEIRDAQ